MLLFGARAVHELGFLLLEVPGFLFEDAFEHGLEGWLRLRFGGGDASFELGLRLLLESFFLVIAPDTQSIEVAT